MTPPTHTTTTYNTEEDAQVTQPLIEERVTVRDGPASSSSTQVPTLFGVPLKYISLVTLAVQNAALTIIMHTSRTTIPASEQYSAASAVFINELLKGSISLVIAIYRLDSSQSKRLASPSLLSSWRRIWRDIFSSDCWKLSIPAILYVFQNNLQYVAATNLDTATFQVTYQMKILTTAVFSVLLLRRSLSGMRWLALFLLAMGVGIVQIQSTSSSGGHTHTHAQEMHPLVGFMAVTAACFTSGLAGVYFEMVLKNSQADLWVRNVQLSLFSLLPAFLPAVLDVRAAGGSFPFGLFRNFGFWAWATVWTQVLGGLITAVVIKHADNILKGFATSLSIIISFIASVVLFDFTVTPSFLLGASVVLGATWMYNQPQCSPSSATSASASAPSISFSTHPSTPLSSPAPKLTPLKLLSRASSSSKPSSVLGSPVDASDPILGLPAPDAYVTPPSKRASLVNALNVLGLSPSPASTPGHSRSHSPAPPGSGLELQPQRVDHPIYTPPPSRPPSRGPGGLSATASTSSLGVMTAVASRPPSRSHSSSGLLGVNGISRTGSGL